MRALSFSFYFTNAFFCTVHKIKNENLLISDAKCKINVLVRECIKMMINMYLLIFAIVDWRILRRSDGKAVGSPLIPDF